MNTGIGGSRVYRAAVMMAGVATALLAACGGGSGSSGTTASAPPSSGTTDLQGNGGLWEGKISAPGASYDRDSIIGIYSNSGTSLFWIYDGTHGGPGVLIAPDATTVVSEDEFSGSYLGLGDDVRLLNGTYAENGSFSVTVDTRKGSLSGNFISSDSGAAQDNVSFSGLAYDRKTYNRGSSQNDLVANGGSYSFQFNLPGTGSVSGSLQLSISSADNKTDILTGLDIPGCSYSGSVAAISSKYDTYDVTLTRSCADSPSLTLNGLGVLYPAGAITVGQSLVMILSDGSATGVEILAQ